MACTTLAVVLAACSGSGTGPTAPAAPPAVAGTWSGTAVTTVTAGPACLSRQPASGPAVAQITQSGGAISGTLTLNQVTCSFHGTVSGTAISWTQDAQQANLPCLADHLVPCVNQGAVDFLDIGGQTVSVAGTFSGSQLAAAGMASNNIYDPANGQATGKVEATVALTLQHP
jgi:hypothetical protein